MKSPRAALPPRLRPFKIVADVIGWTALGLWLAIVVIVLLEALGV